MLTALVVLFVFSVVVVIHELGHYLVCKALGVRVERFSVGFGREIFGFQAWNTRWSFSLLPLGGYVKPAGEELEESSGAPDEFFGQNWYRRMAIAVAGPVMNYALALACFFLLMFIWGEPSASTQPIVGEVVAGYPAQAAGILPGDEILAINGKSVASWQEASEEIHHSPEKTIDLHVRRHSQSASDVKIVAIVPKRDNDRGIGLIGISPMLAYERKDFVTAWKLAVRQTVNWTMLTLRYLGHAIIERRKPELAGPIGIVSLVAKVSKQGLQELMSLVALISLSLGLFNFFPIPLLDGGHMALYLMEGILRRPLNKKMVRAANLVGATLLLMVFVFATAQDLSRLKSTFWK